MTLMGGTATVSPARTNGTEGRARRSTALWSWGVFAVALGCMLVIYRQLWTDPLHSTLGSRGHTNDPMQMMWFLKWVPWQIMHGHNPFATDALFYPYGLSLAWNTLTPTLGILAAPLTLTVGPALSFAVLMTLGPSLTALTGFWWLRRYTTHPAPAAVGGLLLAFDPYMSGHLLGHLNLVFAPLVPIMLMLVEDLLWRHPRSQRRTAVYLGLVTAAQLGISEELVLLTAVGSLVALILALWVLPRPTVAALRVAWPGAVLAVGVFLIVASPLLVSQLLLAPTLTVDTSRFRAVTADYVTASPRQLIAPIRPHRVLSRCRRERRLPRMGLDRRADRRDRVHCSAGSPGPDRRRYPRRVGAAHLRYQRHSAPMVAVAAARQASGSRVRSSQGASPSRRSSLSPGSSQDGPTAC